MLKDNTCGVSNSAEKNEVRYELDVKFRNIFNTPDGRDVLENLLSVSGFIGPVFNSSSIESGIYEEGRRSMTFYILSRLGVDIPAVIRDADF